MQWLTTSFELTHPARLVCLAALPVLVYYFYRSLVDFPRWQRAVSLVVRSILILLLVLALTGLTLLHPTHDQYVIFAIDRSTSVGDDSAKKIEDFLDQVTPSGGNRAVYLPFAAEPGEPSAARPGKTGATADPVSAQADLSPESAAQTEGKDNVTSPAAGLKSPLGTNIEAALESAVASRPPGYVPS